jgi:LPS O-antigen subunit length determinant protein (WzzB/FepE family)
MEDYQLKNQYSEDKIDLRELFINLIDSWKLIILITLGFLLLALMYLEFKEAKYNSNILLEIGTYETVEGKKVLIEPVSNLIKEIKVDQYKKESGKKAIKFSPIEDSLLNISYLSSSPELNKNLLNEVLMFSKDRYTNIIDQKINSISKSINSINTEMNYILKVSELSQKNLKIDIKHKIAILDIEIPRLTKKVNSLLKLIPLEEQNFKLLQTDSASLMKRTAISPTLQQLIYSYEDELNNSRAKLEKLSEEKIKLKNELKFLSEDSPSKELFDLNLKKYNLESEVKLLKGQKNTTRVIRGIVTKKINNERLIIILSAICGFIFAVLFVLISYSLQPFLEKKN